MWEDDDEDEDEDEEDDPGSPPQRSVTVQVTRGYEAGLSPTRPAPPAPTPTPTQPLPLSWCTNS